MSKQEDKQKANAALNSEVARRKDWKNHRVTRVPFFNEFEMLLTRWPPSNSTGPAASLRRIPNAGRERVLSVRVISANA